jgi:soluble P-type ATPase
VRPFFTKMAVDVDIAAGDKQGLLSTMLLFLGVMIVRGVMQ